MSTEEIPSQKDFTQRDETFPGTLPIIKTRLLGVRSKEQFWRRTKPDLGGCSLLPLPATSIPHLLTGGSCGKTSPTKCFTHSQTWAQQTVVQCVRGWDLVDCVMIGAGLTSACYRWIAFLWLYFSSPPPFCSTHYILQYWCKALLSLWSRLVWLPSCRLSHHLWAHPWWWWWSPYWPMIIPIKHQAVFKVTPTIVDRNDWLILD